MKAEGILQVLVAESERGVYAASTRPSNEAIGFAAALWKTSTVKRRKRRAPLLERGAWIFALPLLLGIAGIRLSASAAPGRPDYTNFTIIPERNIFNTKRSPAYKPSNKPTRTARNEYVALTGTMLDQRGPMAFFDGSQSDYRKVLKPNDSIAGFQIEDIEHAYVKLKHGTNETILPVNKQLAREEQGEWKITDRADYRGSEVAQSSSSESGTRRDDRGDRRDRSRNRGDRSDNSPSSRNTGPGPNSPPPVPVPPQAGTPVAQDASSGTNTNASASSPGGPQSEADILRILEERRRQEDQ